MAGVTEKRMDRIPKEVAEQIDYLGDRERDYDRELKGLCVAKIVSHWLEMENDLAILVAKAAYVQDRITYLRENILTAYLDMLGADSFEFEGVRREKDSDSLVEQPYIGSVAIRENMHARVSDQYIEKAIAWLCTQGCEDKFRLVVRLDIHPQTLKAVLRKALEAGEDETMLRKVFNLHVTREVQMKVKFKEEKSKEEKSNEGKGGDPA